MKYNKVSRRHFLQGASGSFLALPFLPSLMSKAEAAILANPKFLMQYWSGHGGINLQNINPITSNPAIASQLSTQVLYAAQGHNYQVGNLTSLKSTRASNLPYLSTYLGNEVSDQNNVPTTPAAYSLDPSGNDFDNGASRLTPIVGSFVSDALMNKMNLICGIDFMFGSGHNVAATGNFCNYNGNAPSGNSNTNTTMTNSWVPTIDQVAAAYPAFYGNNSPLVKAVVLNSGYGACEDLSGYISCLRSSSGIVGNAANPFNIGLTFNLLFGGLNAGQNDPNKPKKDFILNKIHDDYVRVSRGAYGPGRRIGKDDRNRFEEFIANIVSIVTGVTSYGVCTIPTGISGSDTSEVRTASGDPQTATTLGLYNQMIVAAFSCGLTQTFTFCMPGLVDQFFPSGSPNPSFTDGTTGPDTHQALFHWHNLPNRQQLLTRSQRFYFQYGFYDLMQKLNAVTIPDGSGTLLDQSFMYWTAECGFNTHGGMNLPMVTAGGAGGFIKTGKFVDYRAPNRFINDSTYNSPLGYMGVPLNRFLGTVLQALGVPPSAYELSPTLFTGSLGRIPISSRGTVPGYGHTMQNPMRLAHAGGPGVYQYDYQLNDMSIPLPGIT